MEKLPTRGASEEDRRRLSEMIKRRLLELGINQAELSRRINTSRDNVSGWCQGTSFPRPVMLAKLAGALDLVVSDLYPEALSNDEPGKRELFEEIYDNASNMMRVRMDMLLPMEVAMEIMAVVNKSRTSSLRP